MKKTLNLKYLPLRPLTIIIILQGHQHMISNLPTKLHQNPLSNLRGVALTRNVDRWTDRETDRWTDRGNHRSPPKKKLFVGGIITTK